MMPTMKTSLAAPAAMDARTVAVMTHTVMRPKMIMMMMMTTKTMMMIKTTTMMTMTMIMIAMTRIMQGCK